MASNPSEPISRAAWAIAVVVLLVGAAQAWRAWSPPALDSEAAAEPAPAADAPAERDDSWVREALDAPDARRDGWTLTWEEDLSDLSQLRFTDAMERHADGRERVYDGKLELRFGPGVRDAWKANGGVTIQTPPRMLAELSRSRTLVVDWKGHPPVTRPFPWLVAVGNPEVVEATPGPTTTTGTVRNPTIAPIRSRIRAGWKDGGRWLAGDPKPWAETDVFLAPGQTLPFTIDYAAADRGAPAPPEAVHVFTAAAMRKSAGSP